MSSPLLATAILASTLVLSGAANAGPMDSSPMDSTTVPEAPIGHLQPRAQQFSPDSKAEQTVQKRQSNYDAEQQKLDVELDKRLNICRRC